MKITVVQGAFLPVPPLMGGAIEKRWYALTREFARRGHEITHISRHHPDLVTQEVVEGVRYLRVQGYDTPSSMAKLKALDFLYSYRAARALPEADILVTNTFWLPVLVRSAKHGKLCVHVARYPKGQMRLYRKATRLQAVSTAVGNAIRTQEPSLADKVKVIPNFLPEAWNLKSPPLDQVRKPWVLYVGRLHPEKGPELLLDAFARFVEQGGKDWRLVMVGPLETSLGGGGEKYAEMLRQRARPIGSLVDWIGPVFDQEKLKTFFDQSSVFVYPSLAEKGESFGLAPLEAMARGCPPLVSGLECFTEYLSPDTNGLQFDHRGTQAVDNLHRSMTRLMQDQALQRTLRAGGFETASEFTAQKAADRYLADFEILLKNISTGSQSNDPTSQAGK